METESTLEVKRSSVEAAVVAEPAPTSHMETEPGVQGVTTTTDSVTSISPGVSRRQLLQHEPSAAYSRSPNQAWEVRFSELKTWWYASDKGKNSEIPCDARITRWVRKQRGFRVKGTLLPERFEMLNSLEDFEWTTITTRRCAPARSWEDSYQALVAYFNIYQHCNIQHNDSTNIRLYQWSNVQRQSRNEGNLSNERIALLDKLKFNWTHFNEDRWDSYFQQLVEYHNKYGHFRFSTCQQQPQQPDNKAQEHQSSPQELLEDDAHIVRVGRWANKQRAEANQGTLRADRLAKLKDIGFLRGLDNLPTTSSGENRATTSIITSTPTATISSGEAYIVEARLEQHTHKPHKSLRSEGLGPERLELEGKRKRPHHQEEEKQQERKQAAPALASSSSGPVPNPSPPPPVLSSAASTLNDRENASKIKANVSANVGSRALDSEDMLTTLSSSSLSSSPSTQQSRSIRMQQLMFSQDYQIRLHLQFQQLQERRRRQQEQHSLLLRLGLPRLQMQFNDVRRNRGRHEHEQDSGIREQEGQESDEDTAPSWSREDDDLLQELHQAQSRVDKLKAKLAKHMSSRHAQQAVAALVPKPSRTAQRQQQRDSLVSLYESTVLHHHHHQQQARQRYLEHHQEALLGLQQQKESAQQSHLMLRQEILQQQLRQQQQRQQQHQQTPQQHPSTDSILLAAVSTAARARNLESLYR